MTAELVVASPSLARPGVSWPNQRGNTVVWPFGSFAGSRGPMGGVRMVGLTEALALAQTTRNAFNYWLRAGLLSTAFTETQPGVARALSRENVLEIALMSAAAEIGMPPREASGFGAGWLAKDRSGRPQRFHAQRGGKGNWVVLNDNAPVEMVSEILGQKAPGEEPSSRATVFSIIDLEDYPEGGCPHRRGSS